MTWWLWDRIRHIFSSARLSNWPCGFQMTWCVGDNGMTCRVRDRIRHVFPCARPGDWPCDIWMTWCVGNNGMTCLVCDRMRHVFSSDCSSDWPSDVDVSRWVGEMWMKMFQFVMECDADVTHSITNSTSYPMITKSWCHPSWWYVHDSFNVSCSDYPPYLSWY